MSSQILNTNYSTINVDGIFIIHYKPLKNRIEFIENYFIKNNITNYYEVRDIYQRENLTDELRHKYCKEPHRMNPAQICITIEHIETYKEIIKRDKDGWYLILEDDATFCPNFVNIINDYLKDVPEDAEYLDISDYNIRGYNPNPVGKWTKLPTTRTNIGYLVKKKTCEKLLQTIIPFDIEIDHHLNRQIKIHDLNVYHIDEPIIIIGSYGSSYSIGSQM